VTNSWGNFPVTEFYQLPIELQTNFNKLACGGEFYSCDNAYLITDGTGEGEKATDGQTIYLYEVCSSSEEAVASALEGMESGGGDVTVVTLAPSGSPAGVTTVTNSPTVLSTNDITGESSGSPTELDLSKAISYIATLEYQILVSSNTNISSADLLMEDTPMNRDLVEGMDVWSFSICKEWNTNKPTTTERKRRLRGRRLVISTGGGTSNITSVQDVGEFSHNCVVCCLG
jgi:hypothetical protein